MTMTRGRAIAVSGWRDKPIAAQAPLKRYSGVPEGRRAAAMLTRLRELVRRIRGDRPRRPGGPREPEENPRRESHWDDPALWMLMLH